MEDKMHKYYRDFCQTILGVDQFNTSVLSGEEDIAKIELRLKSHFLDEPLDVIVKLATDIFKNILD